MEVANTPTGFRQLVRYGGTTSLYVLEATGPYYLAVSYHLVAAGAQVAVLNPLVVKRFIQMYLGKGKSDRKDAQWLFRYGQQQATPRWQRLLDRRGRAGAGNRPPTPVKGPPVKIPFANKLLADKVERTFINPLLSATATDFAQLQHAIDTYSETKDQQLAAQFLADGTWQVPTLIRLRTMELGDAPEYVNDPNQRYIPAVTVKKWHEVGQDFTQKLTPAAKATYRNPYALQLRLAKLFEQTHVPMLVGSDFGGGWLVPGFSLHQEFDELQKAGLAPLTVLQMTTLNGTKFLGRTAEMGSVAPGQNLHRLYAVVRAGRYYSHADLENLKQQVASRQA